MIVGAGASGLAAAYRASASKKELNILVIEKEKLPGRKLSASGNGKANLTNSYIDESCYHSENTLFVKNWVEKHSSKNIISFFEEMGILLYQNNGYFYPFSNQGKQVSKLLWQKNMDLGVNFLLETRVTAIHKVLANNSLYYEIATANINKQEKIIKAKKVILATGGMSVPKLGGCNDGYKLAKSLELRQTSLYPVLSPIYVEDMDLSIAKGVRLDAMVTLKSDNGLCQKELGQVQFNENSLSGIVVMNLSGYLYQSQQRNSKISLYLDIFPHMTWEELKQFMLKQQNQYPKETLELMLSGFLPLLFVQYVLKRLSLQKNLQLENLTQKQINRLTSMLKKLTFVPVYKKDYDKAQVTGGGVLVDEIDWESFESIQNKGLYIIGELLDMYGKCGGYNLTFAILSGIHAAEHMITKL